MDKLIFLDRDGTIIEDSGHIYKVEKLKFIPRSLVGLKKLQDRGYKFLIVTNQAGIAKGLYLEKDYFIFKKEMHKRLEEQGITITAEYFCPHNPDEHCNCRKPNPGMLEKAAKDFNLDLEKCWMIGDKSSDILAGKNAGCKTIHVLTGECKTPVSYADFVARDLIEAGDYILNVSTIQINKNT